MKPKECTEQQHLLPVQPCRLCQRPTCPVCGEAFIMGTFHNSYICKECAMPLEEYRRSLERARAEEQCPNFPL